MVMMNLLVGAGATRAVWSEGKQRRDGPGGESAALERLSQLQVRFYGHLLSFLVFLLRVLQVCWVAQVRTD